MFAVIKTGGKQYKVAEKDVLVIEKLEGDAGDSIVFSDVLMVGTDDKLEIGVPLVDGASVVANVVRQTRGKKIVVFKKKRRKNYRRKAGHKQDLTLIEIAEILTGGKKPSKVKTAAKPAEKKPAAEKAAPEAKKAEDKPVKKAAPKAKAKDKPVKKAAPAPKAKAKKTDDK